MENVVSSSHKRYQLRAFENSQKGKMLTLIEALLFGFILGCIIFYSIYDILELSTVRLKISFFLLIQVCSMSLLCVFSMVGGPFFVQKLFPPTVDEILNYKAERRKELQNGLVDLESSHIKKKRMLEGELNDLYK